MPIDETPSFKPASIENVLELATAPVALLPCERILWTAAPQPDAFRRAAFFRFISVNGLVAMPYILAIAMFPLRLVSASIFTFLYILFFIHWFNKEKHVAYVLTDQRILKVDKRTGTIHKAFGYEQVKLIKHFRGGIALHGSGFTNRIEIWDVEDCEPVTAAIINWRLALRRLMTD